MKILDMHCDTISEQLDIRRKGDAVRIKENIRFVQRVTY